LALLIFGYRLPGPGSCRALSSNVCSIGSIVGLFAGRRAESVSIFRDMSLIRLRTPTTVFEHSPIRPPFCHVTYFYDRKIPEVKILGIK
jgi:hypothetical protein